EQRFRPRLDAERRELVRGRDRHAPSLLAPERTHDHDAEPEIRGEWEEPPLDVALPRVVGDLDRLDPPGSHHLGELLERRGAVVGRAEQADAPRRALLLEPRQVPLPADQVVDLLELDVTAEVRELVGELTPSLVTGGRPDLRRDE